MAIPAKNVLGNPNVTEGNFQIAIEQLRESVIGSGKVYDSANTYMQYDTCVYSGVTYYSKINSNKGNTPSIGTNWGDVADLISSVVHKTGDETIAGVKTFSNNTVMNGNVGVGTSSPIGKLQVKGTNPQLFLEDASGGKNGKFTAIGTNNGVMTFSKYLDDGTLDSEKMHIDSIGNLLLTGGGGLGYGTGSGGTVKQLTSKSTAVTLNKPCGQITMNNASLAAGATVGFMVNNSIANINDNTIISLISGFSDCTKYRIGCTLNYGFIYIFITNVSAEALAEALVINFAIIKGATA